MAGRAGNAGPARKGEVAVGSKAGRPTRTGPSPLAAARRIDRMMKAGTTVPRIAEALGLTDRQVQRVHRRLAFAKPLKAALADPKSGMTGTHADCLDQAARRHGSALDLERWIAFVRDRRPSVSSLKDAIEESCGCTRPGRPILGRRSRRIFVDLDALAEAPPDERLDALWRLGAFLHAAVDGTEG